MIIERKFASVSIMLFFSLVFLVSFDSVQAKTLAECKADGDACLLADDADVVACIDAQDACDATASDADSSDPTSSGTGEAQCKLNNGDNISGYASCVDVLGMAAPGYFVNLWMNSFGDNCTARGQACESNFNQVCPSTSNGGADCRKAGQWICTNKKMECLESTPDPTPGAGGGDADAGGAGDDDAGNGAGTGNGAGAGNGAGTGNGADGAGGAGDAGGSGSDGAAPGGDPAAITVPVLVNPLGGTDSSPQGINNISRLVGKVIGIGLGFLGSLALLSFVYGGFLLMTSRGKPDLITQGTKTMLWAAIGILFVFSSYSILIFIINAIGA